MTTMPREIVAMLLATLAAAACAQRKPAPAPERTVVTLAPVCANTCHVHGDMLLVERQKIRYGYILLSDEGDAWRSPRREKEFPFAFPPSAQLGGCVIRAKTHTDVEYCPSCRKAFAAHTAKHGTYRDRF
jgi:hypothetical protein